METIKSIWFEQERIYMLSSQDKVYSRSLDFFPVLKEASEAERNRYRIELRGEALRWAALDEDIHITSFYKQDGPRVDNEIARIFRLFPQLNVANVAQGLGIDKTLLSKYISGVAEPSEERVAQLRNALTALGRELMAV